MSLQKLRFWLLLAIFLLSSQPTLAKKTAKAPQKINGKTVLEILKDVQDRLQGKSFYALLKMKIIRPRWTRTLKMKSWSRGIDYSFVRILSPQRERGIASLQRGKNLWNYLPRAAMIVRVPESMMFSSWMGSDFNNDDMIGVSSIVRDYNHSLLKITTKNGVKQIGILLTPKPNAAVVWGKLVIWVRYKDFQPLKEEYFNEKGKLVRYMELEKHKMMDGRLFPTLIRMRTIAKPKYITELHYLSVKFHKKIPKRIFTLRNLKRKNW